MKKLKLFFFGLFLSGSFFSISFADTMPGRSFPPGPPAEEVLKLAQQQDKDSSYQEALKNGAVIESTRDEISFTVWQRPKNFNSQTGITLVSLHGHAGWATRDFVVWKDVLRERGYAYLGIQWWYGRSMESFGYAKPNQIYRWIDEALKRHSIPAGRVIFLGYSMGSANSYGVSLYDQLSKNHYFAVNIANSGPMESDFPLYARIFNGDFGSKPFEKTHWLLYCSLKDQELPNACPDMERTKEWLTGFGAHVDWFYKDPLNGHGGFMKGKDKIYNEALDTAEKILKQS